MVVQFYQIPAHRILPSGQAGKACLVKGLFAQAGIVGTGGLGGELVGSDPFHLHLDPGLPEKLLFENEHNCVRLPMISDARSLNLSNSVAIGVYEVLRQWDFPALQWRGQLRDYVWKD